MVVMKKSGFYTVWEISWLAGNLLCSPTGQGSALWTLLVHFYTGLIKEIIYKILSKHGRLLCNILLTCTNKSKVSCFIYGTNISQHTYTQQYICYLRACVGYVNATCSVYWMNSVKKLLLLLLLSSSSSSSTLLSPLCRVFTIIYLKQTTFVGYGIQCYSCSVFTICATCNVVSPVKYIIIIIIIIIIINITLLKNLTQQ